MPLNVTYDYDCSSKTIYIAKVLYTLDHNAIEKNIYYDRPIAATRYQDYAHLWSKHATGTLYCNYIKK